MEQRAKLYEYRANPVYDGNVAHFRVVESSIPSMSGSSSNCMYR